MGFGKLCFLIKTTKFFIELAVHNLSKYFKTGDGSIPLASELKLRFLIKTIKFFIESAVNNLSKYFKFFMMLLFFIKIPNFSSFTYNFQTAENRLKYKSYRLTLYEGSAINDKINLIYVWIA